jgi:hypothetical protein
MTEEPRRQQRVVINEGTLKKNLNPPPASARPPAPQSQVAPRPAAPPKTREKS